MQHVKHAHGAGRCTPTSDEAPAVAAAQGFRDQPRIVGGDFRADRIARQAADAIEGEALLRGEMLHGACRLIEKALEGRSHA